MTNEQIIEHLKHGRTLKFGCNGRNADVMEFIAGLEREGKVVTEDASESQETRRSVRWIKSQP